MQRDPGYLLLPVESIRPNPRNPRRHFDERALDELARSIQAWGQLQPVLVRQDCETGTYQLICGERRWRAHQRAGLRTICAIERGANDKDLLRLALIENMQRVGLARAEKLAALDQLAELTEAIGLRQTASQLKIDPSWLSRQLAVRKDAAIYAALEAGQLGFGQCAELLRAPKHARPELLDRVLSQLQPVTTSTIRVWVNSARAAANATDGSSLRSPGSAAAGGSLTGGYGALVTQLERLGPPRSQADHAALLELQAKVRRLLESVPIGKCVPALDGQQVWVELNCMMCGERAAVVENGKVRPRSLTAVRQNGRQLVCGRCGGALAQGERGVSYVYSTRPAQRVSQLLASAAS